MKRNQLGLLAATVASVSLIAFSGVAMAQSATRPAAVRPTAPAGAAAAAPTPIPQGPVIPGICVFSEEGAVGLSAVGKFVGQRIQQLASQANAELSQEKTGIETDASALEAQKATIAEDVRQQRTLAINQRVTALQRKADLRNRELELTNQKAVQRISTEINPLLRQLYIQHNCSLLLNGQAVLEAAPVMDLTPEVVRQLDARITQFAFDREHLDQPQTAAPGGQ